MQSRFKIDFGSDHEDAPRCAALHPTEPILVTGHDDQRFRMWNISSSRPKKLAQWKAYNQHVFDIDFSNDGKTLVSVGFDKRTILWTMPADLRSEPSKGELIYEHKEPLQSVAISPDSRYVASGGRDGEIVLWDKQNPESPRSLVQPDDSKLISDQSNPAGVGFRFNRSGTRLLSSGARGRVTIWSIPDGEIIKRWQLAGRCVAVYSPDESMIATANGDGTIFLLRNPGAH